MEGDAAQLDRLAPCTREARKPRPCRSFRFRAHGVAGGQRSACRAFHLSAWGFPGHGGRAGNRQLPAVGRADFGDVRVGLQILPDTPIAWRDVGVGALFATALFEGGKYLIALYIGRSNIASSFGAAGALIVLLLWIFYSAQIFLLGAEFTRAWARVWGSRSP